MPFFPQAYLSPEANFFQLLSELDQPQRKSCGPRHARQQTFTPHFDVQEVEGAYELYGELPGIEQNDISIEFTDAQTIVIKGKTERAQHVDAAPVAPTTEATESEKTESHTATVEDEYDEADTPLATPATTATAVNDTTEKAEPQQQEAPKPKFWVAERKVGEFGRSFSFAQRIDQDAVTASLKNGILRVVVPKVQKKGKVVVNVF